MILLLDNYDSFAHNLARYVRQLGQEVVVERNDRISLEEVWELQPRCLIISPGPCTPDDSGICVQLIQRAYRDIPILGVCLGHQAICRAFGARIIETRPIHGRVSEIYHRGHPLFAGIVSPFAGCRYHSLIADCDTMPGELKIIAESPNGLIMGVAHQDYPIIGVQFHPESILTENGYLLLANFLKLAGCDVSPAHAEALDRELTLQRQTVAYDSTVVGQLSDAR